MRKLMAFILTACIGLSMAGFTPLYVSATAGTWGGSGTEANPYVISDKADLLLLATNVANGTDYTATYFVLGNDIDLSSDATAWTPIGYRFSTIDNSKFFKGTFDGNYYSIKNLNYTNTTLANSTTSAIGGALFGAVDGAMIKNLTVASGTVTGSKWVSGICGYATNATISNCINRASTAYVGTAANQSGPHVGGIVGELNIASTISDCKNYGNIRGGNLNVGGIVGDISAGGCIISRCVNLGNVYGYGQGTNNVYQLGGICGNASNTGNTNAISECYNTGSLTSNKTQTDSGGIMGKSFKTIISDCYNTGNIGTGSGVSGIAASGGATNTTGCVYNCVNYGTAYYAISNIPAARCVNNYYDASITYSSTNGGTAASATDFNGTTGTIVATLNAGTHATGVSSPWIQGSSYPILQSFRTTATIIRSSASQVDFSVWLDSDDTNATILVALFDNSNDLVEVKKVQASDSTVTFANGAGAAYAKIFVWDSLTTVKPLCAADSKAIS